jgi:putative transposase
LGASISPMTRIQLRTGLHLVWQGREYVIEQCLASGEIQIKDQLTNTKSILKAVALTQLLFQGELQFLQVDAATTNQVTRLGLSADFTQIPTELREEAKRRYKYVERVLESNVLKKNESELKPIIERVANEIEDSQPPSWLTLYRWLKDYSASGKNIRSLVPKHLAKGNRQPRLHPEVEKIVEKAIHQVYLKPEQAQGTDVYDRVIVEINQSNRLREALGQEKLALPNIAAIYRAIHTLDPNSVAVARYGLRIANQMYDPVLVGPRPTRPLERVEIDHTKLPLFVVDIESRMPIGTPWLSSAIDKYSGITLGYYVSFTPPSYLSVMQCLLHAISPKNYLRSQYPSVENSWDTYGLPEVIVVDNGKEFYSTHFEDACLQLGIVIQYSPPKMPWYKSTIERYFGALNSQLLADKPGKSFSNLMKQYDYDPLQNAVVSFAALQEILQIFIVDVHNQSSHPEFKSPRAFVWSKALAEFPPALPPSSQELKVLIGHITERKITRRGVEFEGLIYNSYELARLRSPQEKSEKAIVKYDPTDLSRIYVFDPTSRQFLAVPALSHEYTRGLTLWQHQVVKQLARSEAEKVDIVALALAKEKIQLRSCT